MFSSLFDLIGFLSIFAALGYLILWIGMVILMCTVTSPTPALKLEYLDDFKLALKTFGFTPKEIDESIKSLPKDIETLEKAVTYVLQNR